MNKELQNAFINNTKKVLKKYNDEIVSVKISDAKNESVEGSKNYTDAEIAKVNESVVALEEQVINTNEKIDEVKENLESTIEAGLATKIDATLIGSEAGQIPVISESGKLDVAIMPSITINNTFIVSTEEEAMELVVENGDIVIIAPTEGESATYIVVDANADAFDVRFRVLNSGADNITKAEVEALIASSKGEAKNYTDSQIAIVQADVDTKATKEELAQEVAELNKTIEELVLGNGDSNETVAALTLRVTALEEKIVELESKVNYELTDEDVDGIIASL